MITGELRSKVDKIWETFWTGGITNPLEVIEQFTYLFSETCIVSELVYPLSAYS